MSKDRIPYVNFYPADFMHGVRGLTAQEVGVYTMMLCSIYEENGPVEYNVLRLSTYAGVREATFEKVMGKLFALGKLVLVDGMLTNARAEIEISNRANKLKIASRAGKISAEKRQQKQRVVSTDVQRNVNHTDTDTYNTSSLRSEVKAQAPAKASVQSELMKVLDQDHAKAVIEHRKALKKPLTPHAAKLLAGQFAKCLDPNAAADAMIENCWQGFKPEWLQNRQHGGHQASHHHPKPRKITDVIRDEARKYGVLPDEPDYPDTGLLDAGYSRGSAQVLELPVRAAVSGFR